MLQELNKVRYSWEKAKLAKSHMLTGEWGLGGGAWLVKDNYDDVRKSSDIDPRLD